MLRVHILPVRVSCVLRVHILPLEQSDAFCRVRQLCAELVGQLCAEWAKPLSPILQVKSAVC